MAHTYRYQAGKTEITVMVNSDWSGYADVVWRDENGHHSVQLPGPVLQAIARKQGKELLKESLEALIDTLGQDSEGERAVAARRET